MVGDKRQGHAVARSVSRSTYGGGSDDESRPDSPGAVAPESLGQAERAIYPRTFAFSGEFESAKASMISK